MLKKLMFKWLTVISFLVLLEIFSFGALKFLQHTKEIEYNPREEYIRLEENQKNWIKYFLSNRAYRIFDPDLGWTLNKQTTSPDRLYQTNNQNIRADKNYPLVPDKNRLRIATFGDSFVHGNEVVFADTWQQQLEKINPKIETLNFGVQGYGVDQAFLRYTKEGVNYQPHIVILALIVHDMKRNLSSFRPFDSHGNGSPFTKPRFEIHNDALTLIESPFKKASDYQQILRDQPKTLKSMHSHPQLYDSTSYRDGYFDFLNTVKLTKVLYHEYIGQNKNALLIKNEVLNKDSYAFQLTVKIIEEFQKTAEANNSTPIIALFPSKREFKTWKKHKTDRFEPLSKTLKEKNIHCINFQDLLEADQSIDDMYEPHGHYSAQANKIVAETIHTYLLENNLLTN